MSETNGITNAHSELKNMQIKLQSTVEELRQESKQIRNQNELKQNELTRMMNQIAFNNNSLQRISLPRTSAFS
jgi:hypothetical protein